jgi:hypothetical protein
VNGPGAILVDAHVHLHDCFVPARFLDHAAANFKRAAADRQWEACPGALLLTESAGTDWFGRLALVAAGRAELALGSWRLEPTGEPVAVRARSEDCELLLIAGRQVVAREGLEVLLLGTRIFMADRLPIREVLAEGERAGALRVIPWGVGKWLFGRGRLLDELLLSAPSDGGLFLGDSSGRPFFWGEPRQFAAAAARGIRVLPGTDPLPFPSEVRRPGRYGFRLEHPGDLTRPAEAIFAALRRSDTRLTRYGSLERLGPFVRNQWAMQRRRRRRGLR